MLMILVSGILAALFLNVRSFNTAGGVICLKEHQLNELANATPISFSDFRNIPEYFDGGREWKHCPSIARVARNLEPCDASWAYVLAETLTDRWCIMTKDEKKKFQFSGNDLFECCPDCFIGRYCNSGAHLVKALRYLQKTGVTTGAENRTGCKPIMPALSKKDVLAKEFCHRFCRICYKRASYKNDKKFMTSLKYLFNFVGSSADNLKKEIMTNGPVITCMKVSEKLLRYVNGVYVPAENETIIGNLEHCVKIMGWGVELNDVPFWWVVNSWGLLWGEDGKFKFPQNSTKLGFGGVAIAPMPKPDMDWPDGDGVLSSECNNLLSIPQFKKALAQT
ncbi:hypothetical protein Zmor_009849 [Zophobas morio]|uniref:Peptidase C1A papain C-terminal domain-containing protein n=1 Tax=Zophobas morio TaxID=2755281 RepID=A0AA38MJ86_9CUCU|nr:hypothetical protein Zmor_009849 [Zophobas morio]